MNVVPLALTFVTVEPVAMPMPETIIPTWRPVVLVTVTTLEP